ncbi:phloretin 4'-O-glucosyltransferase-like [Macadamia integrifolia]|uniref:phloretin 4'-O-glucosyltransferase-like n=1 Tax=Macadamia integrifolia TaxID=60698 RepID=UPI001C4E8547|nr:phloretin 4'-O-glucosyltransferase-like [Macadamia integrifolia]
MHLYYATQNPLFKLFLNPLQYSSPPAPTPQDRKTQETKMEHQRHFLLVTFPAQGHINPTLQFAKRLIAIGARVTLATTVSAHRRMSNSSTVPHGLTFAPFSDGYDDGYKPNLDNVEQFLADFQRRGSQALTDLVLDQSNKASPVTCIVYTLLLPWAADVARNLHVPSALLWIQPATVLDIYYYHYNGYGDVIANRSTGSSCSIDLPGLPLLTSQDVPSFFLPSNTYTFALKTIKNQFETLEKETNPHILVNTFDALEPQGLKAVENLNLVAIGPLIPSAYLDCKDPSDKSFGGDLFKGSSDYIEWLNSKPNSSVVYVSFGSIALLPKRQMEAIADGLLRSRRPFLWVIRRGENEVESEENKILDRLEDLKEEGLIVPWCSQVEVLSHASVGCFVTHCGWNSTLESLVTGVPVVAFPQWTDQPTNAKLIQDVWKTGMRVKANEEDEGIVDSEELVRCLEMAMEGESAEEMRKNAKHWRNLATEAAKDGGSSDRNLRAFVDEMAREKENYSTMCNE